MKKQKPIITPNMLPKLDIDLENIDFERLSSKEYRKEFESSVAYKKYVQPALAREKARKMQIRKNWWVENCWDIINFLIAISALIISILK